MTNFKARKIFFLFQNTGRQGATREFITLGNRKNLDRLGPRGSLIIRCVGAWLRGRILVYKIFSDYDLSLICTSKCDEQYLKCISSCSDSNCSMDCNRDSVACSGCKLLSVSYSLQIILEINPQIPNIIFSLSMSHRLC